MKRIATCALVASLCLSAHAEYKALYTVKGDNYTKYNFGVAGDLMFGDNGHSLKINGYGDVINLDDIDYITFNMPTSVSAMTPTAQKEKLVAVGEAVNKLVDLNQEKALLVMLDRFFVEGYDEQKYEWYKAPAKYDVPQEYWDVHNEFMETVEAIGNLAKGKVAGLRAIRNGALNTYKVSDYFGVYEADSKKEEWVRSSKADYLELKFTSRDNHSYSIKLTVSDDFTTYSTKDGVLQWPKEVKIVIAEGENTLADVVLNMTFVQDKSITIDTTAKLTAYKASSNVVITNSNIVETASASTIKDNTEIVSATSVVNGQNLLNYDVMYDSIETSMHRHDSEGNCIDGDGTKLAAHFYSASAKADIIGQLQLNARVAGFGKLYDAMSQDSDMCELIDNDGFVIYADYVISTNSDKSKVSKTGDNVEVLNNVIRKLSDHTDVAFSYDNENAVQGYITFDTYVDTDEYDMEYEWQNEENPSYQWGYVIVENHLVSVSREKDWENQKWGDWNYNMWNRQTGESKKVTVAEKDVIFPKTISSNYYDIEPRLMFKDGTNFSFENFFDEVSFRKLIDDWDSIVDTYDTIIGTNDK